MKTLVTVLSLGLAVAGPVGGAQSFPPDFLDGDYVVVGREPGGGSVYAGRARIESAAKGLRLLRRLEGAATETFAGGFEPAAGRDARVMRFRGPAARPRTFTCLVGSDLDNYGRLTCYWTYDADAGTREPGLETFFASGAWPDDAPHKRFVP